MEMNELLWWNNLKEGEKYLFSFLFIDRVKSTEDESKENAELFHRIVENAIIAFNGKLLEWHGDGNAAFFYISQSDSLTEQAQLLSKKAVDAAFAIYEGLLSQKSIPHLRLKAYISINIGMLTYKKNMGEIKSNAIDVGGHMLKACPSESILSHEDVCGLLADDEKDKFRYCGTTIKDNAPVFIYPKKSELGNKQNEFIPSDKDNYYTKTQYLKFIKDKYGKLIPKGLRQERLVSIDLFKIFSPPKFRIKEEFDTINKKNYPHIRRPLSSSLNISILDLIKRKRHSIVLGSPGSGKSTLIKWLALCCANGKISITQRIGLEEELIPLPVSIGHLSQIWLNNNRGIGLLGAIIQYFKIYSQDISQFIESYLEQGKVFILFDGMDEITSDLEKKEIAGWLEAFIQRYASNRFIITSRIIGFPGIVIDGDKYVIEDLNINEAKPLIEKWMTAMENYQSGVSAISETTAKDEAKKLIETLEKMPQFSSFIKNPFLITLIVLIHRTEAALPRYRIQLFERMIQTLVETWQQARSIGIIQPDKQKMDFSAEAIPILAPLALYIHENFSAGIILEDDLKKFIEKKLKEQGISDKEIKKSTDNFLQRLKESSGLLEEKGRNLWGFSHLSFEEYLCAVELVRDDLYFDYLKKYTYNSRWEEIFILVAGELGVTQKNTKKVSAYIRKILQEKGDEINENILKKHILLAGKCLGSTTNVEIELLDEMVFLFMNIFKMAGKTREEKLRGRTIKYLAGAIIEEMLIIPYVRDKIKEIDKDLEIDNWINLVERYDD